MIKGKELKHNSIKKNHQYKERLQERKGKKELKTIRKQVTKW